MQLMEQQVNFNSFILFILSLTNLNHTDGDQISFVLSFSRSLDALKVPSDQISPLLKQYTIVD